MSYRSLRRPIYGQKRVKCIDKGCPDLSPAFLSLSSFIKETSEVVGTCYDRPALVSEIIGEIRGKAYMSPKLLIRLLWRQTYPGVSFSIYNKFHRLQIKDLYISHGYTFATYSDDPLFKDALGLTLV